MERGEEDGESHDVVYCSRLQDALCRLGKRKHNYSYVIHRTQAITLLVWLARGRYVLMYADTNAIPNVKYNLKYNLEIIRPNDAATTY